ncbi:ABC transporter permease [Rhodoferax sp. 4810]|uniref:ABC transporter permease n=1 Tax=Thiospirillum jenense TaxID=1653858 RepID=A0A839HAL2_9GAMM|nr:nickel ABC transporter permease [Thiospirillum jenense]MBB1073352.1 ABC transporter permease [Rhodoferax jenense]MBB1125704.1 ABC transporter permease [Thiospirillum jenense]
MRVLFTRLSATVIVIFGVCTLVFLLLHVIPGDPIEALLGERAQAVDQAALRAQLGLDQPLTIQYVQYLTRLAQGDLGQSLQEQSSVTTLLAARLPATVLLAIAALTLAIGIALPLGVLAAQQHKRLLDMSAMTFSLIGLSMPNFWLGPMLILIFSLTLGWLPISGNDSPASLILPAMTLGTGLAALLARMVRASLLEVLNEDYVRTARAKGATEWQVLWHHALRNAWLPIITVLGLQLGGVLGGAVITETIFAWPGIGSLLVEAIKARDYPVVQGCVLLISLIYVSVNTLTDLAYLWLDPRVRFN